MNAAFVMLTSAWLAGADPAPPAAAAPVVPAPPAAGAPSAHHGPTVIHGGSCAGGCGSTYDYGCGCDDGCGVADAGHRRGGLLSRLFRKKRQPDLCGDVCAPAPVYHQPVYVPAPVHKPAPVHCCPAPAPVVADPCHDDCGCGASAAASPRRGLLGRVKGLFGKKGHGDECCGTTFGGCDSCCSGCGGGVIAPVAPQSPALPASPAAPANPLPSNPPAQPKPMPTTIGGQPTIITPAKVSEENRNPFDLSRRYLGKAQASADYSTLTGQLFFVHTDGGRWVVRYAPISQEDRYGGSVVLARDVNMDTFQEGDLVEVEGEVLADKTNLPLGGALYRANQLNLVERGQGLTAQ